MIIWYNRALQKTCCVTYSSRSSYSVVEFAVHSFILQTFEGKDWGNKGRIGEEYCRFRTVFGAKQVKIFWRYLSECLFCINSNYYFFETISCCKVCCTPQYVLQSLAHRIRNKARQSNCIRDFLSGNEAGMLDFMVWPWFERLPMVYSLSAELHPNLANWLNLMHQEPAIKETARSKEDHLKFYEGYLNSKPVYDFWTISELSIMQDIAHIQLK